MFSMERAAKLLLWACLAYQYSEVQGLEVPIGDEILSLLDASTDNPGPAMDALMEMFECEEKRVYWERSADTKGLVAWGPRTIVVAFRGTATVNNALKDLQVCARFSNWRLASCSIALLQR
jgi:hypothetical protein